MKRLNKKEQAWLNRVQKALDACPEGMRKRADSCTIGDNDITIFDKHKFIDTGQDVCMDVEDSKCALGQLIFPFIVSSTAG